MIRCPSNPAALAMFPISLAKLTFTARQAFEVYFTISAVGRSTMWLSQGRSRFNPASKTPVAASSAPKTIRPGSR